MDGWHHLGEYEYKKGETAEIRLSDKCGDGVVIADAVKWVPADQRTKNKNDNHRYYSVEAIRELSPAKVNEQIYKKLL